MKGRLFFLANDHIFMRIITHENIQNGTYVSLKRGTPVLILDRETTVLSSWYVQCLTNQGILHESPENMSKLVQDYDRQLKNIRINGAKLDRINSSINHIDTK